MIMSESRTPPSLKLSKGVGKEQTAADNGDDYREKKSNLTEASNGALYN